MFLHHRNINHLLLIIQYQNVKSLVELHLQKADTIVVLRNVGSIVVLGTVIKLRMIREIALRDAASVIQDYKKNGRKREENGRNKTTDVEENLHHVL